MTGTSSGDGLPPAGLLRLNASCDDHALGRWHGDTGIAAIDEIGEDPTRAA